VVERELWLENFCCDLVACREFEPLLVELFSRNAGDWQALMNLAASSSVDLTPYEQIHSVSDLQVV
jgi:hypothetical protein